MSLASIIQQEARLIILKALAEEADGRLNSSLLVEVLASYGISKPRDFVHAELRFLESSGAVEIQPLGSVLIATLTQRGVDHVERRIVMDGVKRPSFGG